MSLRSGCCSEYTAHRLRLVLIEQDAPICFAVNADTDQPQCVRELQIQISYACSQFLQIGVRLVLDSEYLMVAVCRC